MSSEVNPSSNALVSFVNPQQTRSNLSLMTTEERDEIFLNLIFANAVATQNQQQRINELTTQLESGQEDRGALRDRVEQQQDDLNQVCALANSMTLNNVNLLIEKTWFPKKELIWKRRVMEALMRVKPSARPNEVEQAYLTNRNTRQLVREFINEYKRFWRYLSNRRNTLICYAKLVLNSNPLISWERILPMLENAKQKITEQPQGSGYCESVWVENDYGYAGYEMRYYKVSYVLEPKKAAGLLFNNPNIRSVSLWTECVSRGGDPDHVDVDYSD